MATDYVAALLIQTARYHSVEAMAEKCGFPSRHYSGLTFKNMTGAALSKVESTGNIEQRAVRYPAILFHGRWINADNLIRPDHPRITVGKLARFVEYRRSM